MAQHVMTPLYACSFDLSHDEYQARYDDLASDGYRLLMVDGYRSGSGLRYGGIWLHDEAAVLTRARHGLTSSGYQSAYDDLRERGYQLTGVTGLSSAAGKTATTFAAVWNDGSWRGFTTHHDMTAQDYQAKLNELLPEGFKVIYVTGYASGASARFAAIWSSYNKRSQAERHNIPSDEFYATYIDLKDQGLRLTHLSGYEAGGETFFAGIWVKEAGYDPIDTRGMPSSTFKTLSAQRAGEDKRLTCISGYRDGISDVYAAIWVPHARTWHVRGRADAALAVHFDSAVEGLMKDPARTIPGGALAVTRNGELVLARGYSWITDVETPVEPTSLFRLGSISKSLTAAAIVLLTEKRQPPLSDKGQLHLTDKLVNLIDMPGVIFDSRVKDITVDHLLHHVGGWDRDASDVDPANHDRQIATDLEMPLPITRDAVIRWTNEYYPNKADKQHLLDFAPGHFIPPPGSNDKMAYSNYGYMLLGQIIETFTGIPYETFVQQHLLAPLGINRMRIGRTLLHNRLPDEVLYHSMGFDLHANVVAEGAPENAMLQYGGVRSFENSGPNGGWVGTAVDLARFASSLDEVPCPILTAHSVNQLFATPKYVDPSATGYYACGWYVEKGKNPNKQWNGGTLEGTKTEICRWQDSKTGESFCASLLFNKYDSSLDSLDWDLFKVIRDAAAAASKANAWPTTGFWSDYF